MNTLQSIKNRINELNALIEDSIMQEPDYATGAVAERYERERAEYKARIDELERLRKLIKGDAGLYVARIEEVTNGYPLELGSFMRVDSYRNIELHPADSAGFGNYLEHILVSVVWCDYQEKYYKKPFGSLQGMYVDMDGRIKGFDFVGPEGSNE
jgi:hypothetical protein